MSYKLKFSKNFQKDFAKLDSITQTKILVILESMKISPFQNCKKLKNVKVGIFRIRIGNFRLRFDCLKIEILLYRIRDRKDVYK